MERMDRKRVSEGAEGWGETGGWMLEKVGKSMFVCFGGGICRKMDMMS